MAMQKLILVRHAFVASPPGRGGGEASVRTGDHCQATGTEGGRWLGFLAAEPPGEVVQYPMPVPMFGQALGFVGVPIDEHLRAVSLAAFDRFLGIHHDRGPFVQPESAQHFVGPVEILTHPPEPSAGSSEPRRLVGLAAVWHQARFTTIRDRESFLETELTTGQGSAPEAAVPQRIPAGDRARDMEFARHRVTRVVPELTRQIAIEMPGFVRRLTNEGRLPSGITLAAPSPPGHPPQFILRREFLVVEESFPTDTQVVWIRETVYVASGEPQGH